MNIGCSSFSWQTIDGKHLLGRTYDYFGNLDSNSFVVIPRNYEFSTLIETKSMVKSEYVVTGMNINGLDTPFLVDGINEHGLMGALLNYSGFACYDTNDNYSVSVNPSFIVTYMLSTCKTLDEVEREAKAINFSSEKVFGNEIRVHFIFFDSTGEAIIVEPNEGGVTVHRNTIGVMTNSPNYEWHEQNIRNYLGQSPLGVKQDTICGKEFKAFGVWGLRFPGGYAPTDRFIRVALTKNFSPKGNDELDGVTRMFNMFSTVYMAEGIVGLQTDKGSDFEFTQSIDIMCSESLKYYFSLTTNRRISCIDLKKELNNTKIKYIEIPKDQDVSFIN